MRAWGVLAVALAASLACSGLFLPPPVGPPLPKGDPMQLTAPDLVSARPGDTLDAIAARHGVSVAELREWNELPTDDVRGGQILVVWSRTSEPPPPVAIVARAEPLAPAADVAAAPAPSAPDPVVVAPPPTGGVVIERPAAAGVLGVEVAPGVDLQDAAASLERFDTTSRSQLGTRSLRSGDTVETLTMPARPGPATDPNAPRIPDTPVGPPRLTKPPPKQCKRGGATEIGDDGVVSASASLSVDQIRASMAQIGRQVIRCFPSSTRGTYVVSVEVTAGCDGRVSMVTLLDGGIVPARITSCVTQTLAYAEFPAHGVPDGVVFQYPMKFTF